MRKLLIFLFICILTIPVLALQKNVAGQKIAVYAYDSTDNSAKTGDAANITAYISQDWTSDAVSDDTNPTEYDATNFPGMYVFDVIQGETNGDVVALYAVSSTSDILLDIAIFHTTPPNFPDTALSTLTTDQVVTPIATGTAQSGTSSTIVLAASSAFGDDILNGGVIKILDGTGAGQQSVIISNTLSDDTCNMSPDWDTNPGADSVYEIVDGTVNVDVVKLADPISDSVFTALMNAVIEFYGLDHQFYNAIAGGDVTDDSFAAQIVDGTGVSDYDNYNKGTDAANSQAATLALIKPETDKIGPVDSSLGEDIAALQGTADSILVDTGTDGVITLGQYRMTVAAGSSTTSVIVDASSPALDASTYIALRGGTITWTEGAHTPSTAKILAVSYAASEWTFTLNRPWYTAPQDGDICVLTAPDYVEVSGSTGHVLTDMRAIDGDEPAAANLESQYDTTGLSGDNFPATQAQVGNLSFGSDSVNTTAASTEATTPAVVGTPTNTYTSTVELDGVYHSWIPAGGTLEFAYNFNIGANSSPTKIKWAGYCQTQNDDIEVYARNWVGVVWEQIGTIDGLAGTTTRNIEFDLTNGHVNTGANSGDVRIRFYSTSTPVITTFATDRILCSYTITNQSAGYVGSIWVDTNASNTNTVDYVDGTSDNPVSTWAAALTLSSSLGMNNFRIANGSSITLSSDSSNYTLMGVNWALSLGGQAISGAHFVGADVVGTATGTMYTFNYCELDTGGGGDFTVSNGNYFNCAIAGDLVLTGADTYYFDQCYSGVAGTGTPSIDFGVGVGNTNLNMRHYSGGIEILNLGDTGTDNMSLEGWGQIIFNANCDGGNASIRGSFSTSGAGLPNVTVTEDARFNRDLNYIITGVAQATGNTSIRINLAQTASTMDGAYDPGVVDIVGGTGVGQSRQIWEYDSDGTDRFAYVNRDFKVVPDNTSIFEIRANSGDTHVNEGVARGGTSNTIILNALASTGSTSYLGQIVFIGAGIGADDWGVVLSYDNGTQTATVHKNWDVTPVNGQTVYAMLPEGTLQTGDSFARIGIDGAGLTSIAPAATALTNATWTDAAAGALIDWIDGGRLDLLLDFLINIAEGDSYIDTSTTPWQAVIHEKDNISVEYVRKDLFDVSGGDITGITTVIGQQKEP